jgi:hypothetical protein
MAVLAGRTEKLTNKRILLCGHILTIKEDRIPEKFLHLKQWKMPKNNTWQDGDNTGSHFMSEERSRFGRQEDKDVWRGLAARCPIMTPIMVMLYHTQKHVALR